MNPSDDPVQAMRDDPAPATHNESARTAQTRGENSGVVDRINDDGDFARNLGVDDYWRAHLQMASMEAGIDLTLGRVSLVHRGGFHVFDTHGAQHEFAVGTPGHCLDSPAWPPVVGDWIGVEGERIAAILPRRTFLSRPSASCNSANQAIGARFPVGPPCASERTYSLRRRSGDDID